MRPKLPSTLGEVHDLLQTQTALFKTNRKENFVIVNDRENHIVGFSCKKNLKQ